MSMEVYDISTGALVLSVEADQWDGDFLSGKSNKQSEEVTLLREGEDSEVTQILLDGTMREGPELVAGLEKTCNILPQEMTKGLMDSLENR